MGECGCGDFDSQYKLAGPEGVTYSINIYSSCHYCNTPVAVDIYRHSAQGVEEWGVNELPDLPIHGYGAVLKGEEPKEEIDGLGTIVVLDPDVLTKVLNEDLGQDFQEQDIRFAIERAIGGWEAS